MSDVRVGIVGAGAIGASVADALLAGAVPGASLSGVLVRGRPAPECAFAVTTVGELLSTGPTVVVEAASHAAVADLGEPILGAGRDLVCVSVGALADDELRARLLAAARASGSRLIVPSGAVGGLDILRAAAEGDLDEVVIEQRKPPHLLLDAEAAARLEAPLVVFEGPAREAVARYPKTTNVAAAVALAGLGFERTTARVVADPAIDANQAVLTARGGFGAVTVLLRNVASANPRTSAVTAHSVLATLRRLADPLVV